MKNLPHLLAEDILQLDGVTLDGDWARAELGIKLLPDHSRTYRDLDVAVYLRISFDKDEDAGGVRRQGIDGLTHVLLRGAARVKFFVENDTSAFRKKRMWMTADDGFRYFVMRVVRPRWEAMLRELREGTLRGVGVYDIDRLARDNRDLEDAIEIATYYRRRFEGATGSLDLHSDNGIAMARVMVAMANKQSADTARRVRRKHQELAELGVPVGSTRPFGYLADKRTKDPVESVLIQDAVSKILAGVTPTAILNDWHGRGIKTSLGNTWAWTPFLTMIRNPRYCGYRSRRVTTGGQDGEPVSQHWEIVKKPDGSEVKGQWESIITRAEWELLIQKIGYRARPTGSSGGARKYLLSGLVRCGRCRDHPKMTGGTGYKDTHSYSCPNPTDGGCSRNTRNGPKVDELIRELVFRRYDEEMREKQDSKVQPATDPQAVAREARLSRLNELLDELYAEWKDDRLPTADYFSMRKDLDDERKQLQEAKASAEQSTAVKKLSASVRDRWGDVSVDERRAFLETYLSAVIVNPIEDIWDEKRGKTIHPTRFNPDLIVPVWR